jgi:hypothetical protein
MLTYVAKQLNLKCSCKLAWIRNHGATLLVMTTWHTWSPGH